MDETNETNETNECNANTQKKKRRTWLLGSGFGCQTSRFVKTSQGQLERKPTSDNCPFICSFAGGMESSVHSILCPFMYSFAGGMMGSCVCVAAGRHASLVEFSAYMNSVVTFLVILYISHVLACAWFWVGNQHAGSGDDGGVESGGMDGWVVR